MKTFEQNGINYLAVELEREYLTFAKDKREYLDDYDRYYLLGFDDKEEHEIAKFHHDFDIIGLLPEITEEQAKEMVEECDETTGWQGEMYLNYNYKWLDDLEPASFSSSLDSLKSRLRSLGLETENILIIKQLT